MGSSKKHKKHKSERKSKYDGKKSINQIFLMMLSDSNPNFN